MNRDLRIILRESDNLMFATAYYLAHPHNEKRAWLCNGRPSSSAPFATRARLCRAARRGDSTRGPALGLFGEPTYLSGQTNLDGGDVLLVFTDGLFEAVNEADIEFGEARLAAG